MVEITILIRILRLKIKINLSPKFDINLSLKYLKLYIKKIKAKENGVNNPNSFNKNPEIYEKIRIYFYFLC